MTTPIADFISTKEVCIRIGVGPRTLNRWAKSKNYGPPFIKIGGRYRYTAEQVDEWIAQLYARPPDARA